LAIQLFRWVSDDQFPADLEPQYDKPAGIVALLARQTKQVVLTATGETGGKTSGWMWRTWCG
jgi:hypothetical protein